MFEEKHPYAMTNYLISSFGLFKTSEYIQHVLHPIQAYQSYKFKRTNHLGTDISMYVWILNRSVTQLHITQGFLRNFRKLLTVN